MTIGQLARRTGVSIRALREYEGVGLIYGLGRSDGNYRLFYESALSCLQMIGSLRALGLTLKEAFRRHTRLGSGPGGVEEDVTPVDGDHAVLGEVDAAYRAKYRRCARRILNSVLTPEA